MITSGPSGTSLTNGHSRTSAFTIVAGLDDYPYYTTTSVMAGAPQFLSARTPPRDLEVSPGCRFYTKARRPVFS